MPSFTLDARTVEKLDRFTAERGVAISALVRYALETYRALEAPPSRGREHSVRLDVNDTRRLLKLAKRAKLSKSRTLALLLGMALDDLNATAEAEPWTGGAVALPGPRAFKTWARLILECAAAAPRHLRTGPAGSLVFIGAVADEVGRRTGEEGAAARRAVREILPELAARALVSLRPCPFPEVFSASLLTASAVETGAGATSEVWHCVELR